jgi:hypothetical protein
VVVVVVIGETALSSPVGEEFLLVQTKRMQLSLSRDASEACGGTWLRADLEVTVV